MAVNPQQILNQTVPAAQQPTAQQVPIQQAPSVLPAAQFPGVAGAAPQPSSTQLGQSSQVSGSRPQNILGDLPQLQPYLSSLPYTAALEQQPQLAVPNPGGPALQAIQQKLTAQQASNPLLNGTQPPQTTSKLAQTQSAMSPLGIVEAAAKGIWDQEIVQPVKDYIHTWQTNPGQAFLETLGGVAVTAGIVGLETVTGGGATPFIFAGLAALQAPNLIHSWSQEVMHPSDANLVQAIVSTGAGALAVGSPVRAFKGVKLMRSMLENQIEARKGLTAVSDVADLMVGKTRQVGAGVPGLKTGASLLQRGTLDINNLEGLRTQLQSQGVNLDEGQAATLLRHAEVVDKLRTDIYGMTQMADFEGAAHALAELKDYVASEMRDDFLSSAYHYVYLPTSPFAHVPMGAIQGVESAVQGMLNQHTNVIYSLLRRMHSGIGLQTVSDMAHQNIASIKEGEALDQAAGTPFDSANRIMTALGEMRKVAGIGEDDHEAVNQALEEPEKFQQLSPAHQAYAQKLRDVFDYMTNGDLKYGTISQPLQGTVHRYFTGVASEEGQDQEAVEKAAKRVYTTSWLERPVGTRSDLWKAAVDDEKQYRVNYQIKTRAQIIKDQEEQARLYAQTHEHRQLYTQNEQQFQTWNRSLGQLKRHGNDAGIAALEDKVERTFGKVGLELLRMSDKELGKVLRAAPKTEELVTGAESVKRAITNHVFRVQRAAFGEALQVHSNMSMARLRTMFGKTSPQHWGAQMALPEFKNKGEFPDVLPETVFQGARNAEEAARRLGYFKVHPETGSPQELNYRPALYARDKLANEIAAASEKTTTAEQQSGFVNALYKVGAESKRFIMYNPVYHFLNVAGRAIAFVMSDPAVAGTALKQLGNPLKRVRELGGDAGAFHDLLQEASMSGMVPATQWNVSEHLRIAQREADGQHAFPGAVRSFVGTLSNIHRDTAERGLWSTVDHLQLAGYMYSKQRFLNKGIKEFEARQLAAVYANNLGGMVNPLYMSRMWRQLKGMIFFAPSYWSTFLHSLQSVMPGNARLSGVAAKAAGGRLIGLTSTPLRTVDRRMRIELSRAQRDWMITYLASTAVAMDMMNVMLSGHHLWENEQGHEWNIDVTNIAGTQTSPSGEVKRAYITGAPFFRQGVDIGQAIGLGHDWGFGHVFGDQSWQQQDLLHKAELVGGAMLDGVRRTGSTKLGTIPQTAGNLVTGQDVPQFLGTGTQVKIDRPAALLSLLPNGFQLERLWKTYQQGYQQYKPGTPEYNQARKQFEQQVQNLLPSGVLNLLGIPSSYWMGVERPPIDDSVFENWITQRDAIHTRMTRYSAEVFKGQLSPLEYARNKHDEQMKTNQLNLDTWGPNSPGASLASAYQQLSTQFGLDNPGLSTQDWFERYDAFLPAWNQLLQSAQPSTRAAWWEHSIGQWTDADYLEWEAKQLRDSLAASIDHQGGNYIRAYQNQLFRLKPTMTVAQYQQAQQADPYYSAYTTLLREMGRTSALGAFVSAFSSPYSQIYIPLAGLTTQDAQALAQHTGQVVIRPEVAQQLANKAKGIAQEPQVAQAGGQPEASPEFQQQEQSALAAAQSGIPEAQQ